MSKTTTAPKQKRGRPRVKITKARPSITMDATVLKTARKLACADGLALSTWLEQLVRGRIETANAAQP